jgi:rod shape-determining protein MreC
MVDARSAARLTVLLAIAALMLALSPLPVADDLEARLAAVVAPASSALNSVTRPVADVLLNAGQIRQLSEENAELRRAVARLESETASLREANIDAQQASALVAAVGDEASRYLPAAVVLRDPSPARRVVLIDRGAADGVTPGQPVLGAGATLIGVVSAVEQRQATVRLLSDEGSAVTAVVQQSRVPGALAGGPGGLRLEFVPIGSPVATGDLVLTSSLGGRLPGGLLIGRVTAVHSREQDLFETVEVEPLTDYARLERVLILTDFLTGAAAEESSEPTP